MGGRLAISPGAGGRITGAVLHRARIRNLARGWNAGRKPAWLHLGARLERRQPGRHTAGRPSTPRRRRVRIARQKSLAAQVAAQGAEIITGVRVTAVALYAGRLLTGDDGRSFTAGVS